MAEHEFKNGDEIPPGILSEGDRIRLTASGEIEATLMHADDGTPCWSMVSNDAGTLRCVDHSRAVYGSGWNAGYFEALEHRLAEDRED